MRCSAVAVDLNGRRRPGGGGFGLRRPKRRRDLTLEVGPLLAN